MVAPLYWIIGLGLATAPICLSRQALDLIRQSRLPLWCYGFLLISGTWLLFQRRLSEVGLQEFETRILSVTFIFVLLCLFAREDVLLWARWAILVAVLVAVGLNVYETFNPMTFSLVMGRAAGLYMNPNQTGAALILGMILSIGVLPHRYRMALLFLVGMGVFLTFSRSAIVSWALVSVVIVRTGQVSMRRSLAVIGAIFLLVVSVAVWQWDTLQNKLEDVGVLNENVMARVNWFNSLEANDFSSAERKEVAEYGWQLFADSPVFGQGVGASIDWIYERSSHNEYLNMMVDHGLVGMFILPLLVVSIVWRSRGEARKISYAFAAFILYWGFFSHNVFHERHFLLAFALLSALTVASRVTQPQKVEHRDESHAYHHCFAR